MTQTTLNLSAGQARKERGLNLVEAKDFEFIETMRDEAELISGWNGRVTIDDLREYAATINITPSSPNSWGCIFRGKQWKCIGYTQSKLPSNHARRVAIWTLSK